MNIQSFKDQLFEKGTALGFTEMELYVAKVRDFSVKVFEQEVDDYSLSDTQGISFRGKYQGKMGYSYTEILDEESLDLLVNKAKANAEMIDSTDDIEIFAGSAVYPEVETFDARFPLVTVEEKIRFAKALESEAKALDERVKTVGYALVNDVDQEIYMANSKGLEQSFRRNGGIAYVAVVVVENGVTKTGARFVISNEWKDFDAKTLTKEAVEEALSLLVSDSVESKPYKVLLRNDVAADMLNTFSSLFSADAVQKGMSLLAGKLETAIANPMVTILDDPLLPKGHASAPFDSEGVATKTKAVVEEGILRTFLHNTKTAKKDGVESTGNAQKPSYKSPVGVAPTNFFIPPKDKTYEALLQELGDGLVIINVQGLHSGANPVSGDFSLGAYGYKVENGEIKGAVDQITIAGNFLQLLNDVQAIGNDLKFGFSGFGGSVGSPSLLIKSLAVAGK